MPRKPVLGVTDKLNELRADAAASRHSAREADVAAQLAFAKVEEARGERVEAHASGDAAAIRDALAAYQAAEQAAEEATLAAEGARITADRAQAEVEKFKTENADALIAELEPAAADAVEQLRRHADGLREADAGWRAVANQVDDLLRAHPTATPADDGPPINHGLEAAVRAVRNAGEVQPPLPRWVGVEHRRQQAHVHRRLGLERNRRLAASEQR